MQPAYYLAQHLLDQNISSFPCFYYSKKPHYKALQYRGYTGDNSKASWKILRTQLPTPQDLRFWYTKDAPSKNLAMITSDKIGVIDFDDYQLYRQYHSKIKPTLSVTSSRGIHLIYQFAQSIPDNVIGNADKLDWLASGKASMVYGKHKSGVDYEVRMDEIAEFDCVEELIEDGLLKRIEDNAPSFFTGQKQSMPLSATFDQQSLGELARLIKSKLSMINYFSSILKVNPTPTSRGFYNTFCPVHSDHSASAWIGDRKCACRKPGCKLHKYSGGYDIIDTHSIIFGFDFTQSVLDLAWRI